MKKLHLLLTAGTTLAATAGFAGAAHAQAFYLQEQSARGAGRAFSGEVADTGAASLWWNPAAIADAERVEVNLNAAAILPRGEVVDTGTRIQRPGGQPFTAIGGDSNSRNPINNGVLPSGAIALPLGHRIALGLAVTSPYSFTTDYSSSSWARYSADKTRLRTVDIQPSIAVSVTDWLRVGAAANVEYTDATLSNALPNVAASFGDGRQELKGDGWDVGWSAGFQMHSDRVTAGFSYKSAIRHKLKGDLTVSGLVGPLQRSNVALSNVEADFYTPAQEIAGLRWRATDRLTLNGQVVHYNWDKFDAIRLGAPLNQAIPENYRESWSYAGGVDYMVSQALTLRAGVQRATTPTQNGQRDARVPDSNRWNFGAGGSYAVTRNIVLDAAANYVDFADASIDKATIAAGSTILTQGQLRNARAFVFSLGGRVQF
jgi:long-chain fatty acid transport protein